jgi:hypothetical protein
MRDLAHRLVACEAVATKTTEPRKSATLRVYEKLRDGLSEFAGVAGFESIASRALALARTEAPSLDAVRVSSDGELHGLERDLGEIEHPIDIRDIYLTPPGTTGCGLTRVSNGAGPVCTAC